MEVNKTTTYVATICLILLLIVLIPMKKILQW